MNHIERILQDINSAIHTLPIQNARPRGLYEPISYSMESGGKRIRPLLCCLACELFCGDHRRALSPAVALELYHNHTLLHDDLMDDSSLRRGRPTVYHRWGANAAILSGDAMLISAFDHFFGMEQKDILVRLLPLFSRMCLAVCEGQQYDIEFETRSDVRPEEYLEMISLKTSTLIAYSLRIGAIIGGATEVEAERIYQFGFSIGQAFQLEDDLLDVFGTEEILGKPVGGDILHNKKTMLLISAMQRAQGDDAQLLATLLSLGLDDAERKIHEVRDLYIRLGVDTYTRSLIEEYEIDALTILEQLSVAGYDTTKLRIILSKLSKRKK